MVCYHPLQAYRARIGSNSGARPIVFNARDGYADRPVTLACGQCVGCRLERSRQWAVRCMHEAKLHENNCFITLTYSDEHLPPGGSLSVEDHQNFMKRLRDKIRRDRLGGKFKFYLCGEYGERTGRPHYHACIFGFDFPDRVYVADGPNGDKYYSSKLLEALWPFGNHSIGDVTFQSAAYCARYVMKKVTGKVADEYYRWTDKDGVVWDLHPEYTAMSRRGGIGRDFIMRYMADVYPDDFVVVNAKKARPPRFYDSQYELADRLGFVRLKAARIERGKTHGENNTPERRKVREFIAVDRLTRLKREGVK